MDIREKSKGLSTVSGVLAIGAAVIAIPVVLLFGASWANESIVPWLIPLFRWILLACVVVLALAAVVRATCGCSAIGFQYASYALGLRFFAVWLASKADRERVVYLA